MKRIAIAVLLSAIAAPAFAEGYAGLNVGQNKYDATIPDDTSTAVGILGGFGFNRNFAVELGYTDLGSHKGTVWNLSGVGSLPLNDQFSLFAKLGVARTQIEDGVSESKTGATWGIGGQFNATPAIGIRVQYDRYEIGDTNSFNANVMSVGAVFKL